MKKDKGYSWVVLCCSVLLSATQTSIYNSFGVFFLEYVDYFQSNKMQTAAVASLYVSACGLSALLIGPLVRAVGYRTVALTGGLLSGLGLATASASPSIYVLYVTHGILPGMGEACNVISVWMALNSYFDKRNGIAMGMRAFGQSLGMFAGPPFCRFLIDKYGWRGALLVLASCQIQGLVLSTFLRPNGNNSSITETQKRSRALAVSKTRDNRHQKVTNECYPNSDNQMEENTPMKEQERQHSPKCFNRCTQSPNMTCTVSIFKDVRVILYYLSYFFIISGHLTIVVFSPPRGVFIGMTPQAAAFLMFITGICSAVVRPFFGWLGDKRRQHLIIIYSLPAILAGLLSIASSYLELVFMIQLYAAMVGICMASYIVLHPTVLGTLLPDSMMPVGSGYHMLVHGSSGLFANIAAGGLVDLTGSYSSVFLVFGIVQIVGGSLSMLIHVLTTRRKFNKGESSNETVQQHC